MSLSSRPTPKPHEDVTSHLPLTFLPPGAAVTGLGGHCCHQTQRGHFRVPQLPDALMSLPLGSSPGRRLPACLRGAIHSCLPPAPRSASPPDATCPMTEPVCRGPQASQLEGVSTEWGPSCAGPPILFLHLRCPLNEKAIFPAAQTKNNGHPRHPASYCASHLPNSP